MISFSLTSSEKKLLVDLINFELNLGSALVYAMPPAGKLDWNVY